MGERNIGTAGTERNEGREEGMAKSQRAFILKVCKHFLQKHLDTFSLKLILISSFSMFTENELRFVCSQVIHICSYFLLPFIITLILPGNEKKERKKE